MRRALIIGAIVGLPVATVLLLVVLAVTSSGSTGTVRSVTLNFWGVIDEPAALTNVLGAYHGVRSNVTVTYVKKSPDTYRGDLLDALASGTAPDLFQIPAEWLPEYATKGRLAALPKTYSLPEYVSKQQLFKKVTAVVQKAQTSVTVAELQRDFAPSVAEDGVVGGQIYGLPFAVDSLAVFANRDLLNVARASQAPATWDALSALAANPQLRQLDSQGAFIRSAIGLGTADTVPHAVDILTGLMVQGGATLIDPATKSAHFQDVLEEGYQPGLAATELYTSFASPGKQTYSWNDKQGDAFTAFADGRLGLYLGYQFELDRIKAAAPQLSLDIAPMLHLNTDGTDRFRCSTGGCQPYNVANNWVSAVSTQSKHPIEAWDLIQFIARRPTVQLQYAKDTHRTPVLKAALAAAKTGGAADVWVDQAYTAHTWYHGNDALAAERAMADLIRSVVDLTATPLDAINLAANQVSQTLR